MMAIEMAISNLADFLWSSWMPFLLMGLGIFYTVVTRGIQFRSIPWIIKEFRKKNRKSNDSEEGEGSLSSIQAFYVALASCVGSGNIVGTATALISGGPGALFWMWAAAFFGMATKYAEIILGLVFRKQGVDGKFYGGPMYYIEKGLHAPWLGAIAALLLFFQNASGTLIQSNTISNVASDVFSIPKPVTAIILALVMFFIVKGGLKRLADTAQRIVPIMAALYIAGGTLVVLSNLEGLLPVLENILKEAFRIQAGVGAAAGLTMKEAMRFGVARGLYSNEAGEGSAAVLHSAARVDHPVRQGFYGLAEVFVDTIVICSTTGFSILTSGVSVEGASAATLAAEAYGTVFPALKYVVSISLILFASTSIMSQWYFGHVSLIYIKRLGIDRIYRVLFPVLIFFGSLGTAGIVWAIQDCMLGLLIIPNVLALFVLSPIVTKQTEDFLKNIKMKKEK